MATSAIARRQLNSERKFFLFAAAYLTLGVVIGFGPTWYWGPLVGARPLPAVVHVHGALATLWLLLFATQVGLVAGNRRDLHLVLGQTGIVVAAAAIGTSLLVSLDGFRSGRTVAAALPPATLLFTQLVTVVMFTVFVALALAQRRDAATHKRLMLLASMTIAVPGLARIARMVHTPPLPANAFGGMVIADLLLLALVAYDYSSRGRLHPVTLWAGGLFLLAQPFRYFVGTSAWWIEAAKVFA